MSAKLSGKSALLVVSITIWVVLAFVGAQVISGLLLGVIFALAPALQGVNDSVQIVALQSISYVVAFALIAFIPIRFGAKRPLWHTFGIRRWPSWGDIGLSLLAVLPYLLISAVLLGILSVLIPQVVTSDTQELPFKDLVFQYEYLIAFVALVILAPLAEELFFRGYFMTKLTDTTSTWFAVIFSSIVFGLLHSIGLSETGITTQWQAAIDVTALGLVLASLRIITKNIWAGVILHMFKNGVAYVVLFIIPVLSGTM